jgi:P4 family phage/plasmid primase-like protien
MKRSDGLPSSADWIAGLDEKIFGDQAESTAGHSQRDDDGVGCDRTFQRGDHVELAERLVEALRAQACVFADGYFYEYDAKRGIFVIAGNARLSRIVQGFAGVRVEATHKPLGIRAADVSGAIKLASDRAADPDFFNNARPGIVFADAFVQVEADRTAVHAHSPEHRARFAYDFDYCRNAAPAMLLEFFEQIFCQDSEEERACKIALIQEYVGISLLGLATRYQRAIVFVGAGANGKSALTTIIQGCMPPGSVCAIPPQQVGQEYRRALLAGKLLNIVSELPEADILDSESWKAIVAGDLTTGREIRKAPITFRPIAGHIYSANRLPGTSDQSHGFWRRLVIVLFDRIFAVHEQDTTLADRIVATERPAVVSWALAGAQRVMREGRYTLPASSTAAVADWQQVSDPVRAFVEERCERLPLDAPTSSGCPAALLYRAYMDWARDNGHGLLASNKFSQRMSSLQLPSRRTSVGNFYPVKLRGADGGSGGSGSHPRRDIHARA